MKSNRFFPRPDVCRRRGSAIGRSDGRGAWGMAIPSPVALLVSILRGCSAEACALLWVHCGSPEPGTGNGAVAGVSRVATEPSAARPRVDRPRFLAFEVRLGPSGAVQHRRAAASGFARCCRDHGHPSGGFRLPVCRILGDPLRQRRARSGTGSAEDGFSSSLSKTFAPDRGLPAGWKPAPSDPSGFARQSPDAGWKLAVKHPGFPARHRSRTAAIHHSLTAAWRP